MKNIFSILVLFITFSAQAQYRLSFENPILEANKFRVTLRMNATDKTFSLGSNNLRFNYSVAGLANPKIIADIFPSTLYHETTLVGSNFQTGIISVNTFYVGKEKANELLITNKGVDLVEMEFDVLDETLIAQLAWRIDDKHPKTVVISDNKHNLIKAITANNVISEVQNVKFVPSIKSENVSKLKISSIMPNPIVDDLKINFEANQQGNITLFTTDILGRTIISQSIEASKGNNTVVLHLSTLAAGSYFIKISDGSTETAEKIIKL